jgi:hypothetical protein
MTILILVVIWLQITMDRLSVFGMVVLMVVVSAFLGIIISYGVML